MLVGRLNRLNPLPITADTTSMTSEKRIRLRYDGRCSSCGKFVTGLKPAYYDATARPSVAQSCPAWPTVTKNAPVPRPGVSTIGAKARTSNACAKVGTVRRRRGGTER